MYQTKVHGKRGYFADEYRLIRSFLKCSKKKKLVMLLTRNAFPLNAEPY